MTVCEVVMYGVKSERKNAKYNYKSWCVFKGDDALKTKFTQMMDYSDMEDWLNDNQYNKFKLVVYLGNDNLYNFNSFTFYSKESVLKKAVLFCELINKYN